MFCLYFYHVIYLCSVCGVIPLPKQAMMSSSGAPAHADGPETHISDTRWQQWVDYIATCTICVSESSTPL